MGVQGGQLSASASCPLPARLPGLEGAPPGDLDSWVLNPFPRTSAGLPHAPLCAHGAQPICISWGASPLQPLLLPPRVPQGCSPA